MPGFPSAPSTLGGNQPVLIHFAAVTSLLSTGPRIGDFDDAQISPDLVAVGAGLGAGGSGTGGGCVSVRFGGPAGLGPG